MIDFLGLCRLLVNTYPLPSKTFKIKQSIDDYLLGLKLNRDQRQDIVRLLLKTWKRNVINRRHIKNSNLKNNILNYKNM